MPILQTSLCDLLEIDVPIIQAPIGGAAGPALAAAVSNAGALGQVTQPYSIDRPGVRQRIKETRELTDRKFGVNMLLMPRGEPHQDVEMRIERLNAYLEEGVPIVSFFWGDPSPYVELIHSAGALVLIQVGSVAEASAAADAGVDVIIAQGWEAGGHVRGEVGTLPLIPRVIDAVAPTPVVAAGGIADGRGLAAALALGADGVYVGTRFVVSEESAAHPVYKKKLLESVESDTVYLTDLFDVGWPDAPHRSLRNTTVVNWEAAGRPPSGQRPGEGEVIATNGGVNPVLRYAIAMANSDTTGDIEALPLWAGQGVGLVNRIQPAGEIVRELVEEAEQALRRCIDLVQAVD